MMTYLYKGVANLMKKFSWFAFLFVSLLILFTACSSSPSEEKTSLKLAEVTRSVFYAPQYVALEKGYFSDEGLDVELTTTWGGDKTMTALLSDHADIALVGSETSIYVYSQETTDVVMNFAQLTQTDGTFLFAKSQKENFTWKDMKGEKFLGQRKGGMPQMVGESVLRKHDIDPHNDLDLDQSIDYANIPSAFSSGDYEYVQLFEPTASIFERDGQGHIIASFGEESGKVPYTSFMAKQSYLEDHAEVIQSFTNAIYKAQQWILEQDAVTIAELVSPYFEDTSIKLLADSIERYKKQDSFATDPIIDEEEWNNLKSIMDEAGELPADIPYEELVNTTFAEEAMNQ